MAVRMVWKDEGSRVSDEQMDNLRELLGIRMDRVLNVQTRELRGVRKY